MNYFLIGYNWLQSAHYLDYLNDLNTQNVAKGHSTENTKKQQMKFYYYGHTYNHNFIICIKMRSSLLALKSHFDYFAMAAAAIPSTPLPSPSSSSLHTMVVKVYLLRHNHWFFVRHWFSERRILISALKAIEHLQTH